MTILLLVNYNNVVQSELQQAQQAAKGAIDYNLDFYGRVRQFLEQKLSDANVKVSQIDFARYLVVTKLENLFCLFLVEIPKC